MADWGWIAIADGDRRFTDFMWKHIAADVLAEFRYEGICDAVAFHEDVMSADHRESFWKNGAWVASIWSGWAAEGVRTFGCVVRRQDELPGKVWLAKRSMEMLDGFMSREPEGAVETLVMIPQFMERCIRHAEELCGLRRSGTVADGEGREYAEFRYVARRAER